MNTPVGTFWPLTPKPGNMGDLLTPLILRHLGIDHRWVDQDAPELLVCGSIARFACVGTTVLGAGAMRVGDYLHPGARWLAVRGPLTRARVQQCGGTCPEVYGDPALLLPRLLPEWIVNRQVGYGIVPHYVDQSIVDQPFINLLDSDPLVPVAAIRRCSQVYSSSLHGIIIAHAYGIPAAWVRWSDKVNGDGFKFRDYAASVGIDLVPYASIREARLVCPSPKRIRELQDGLINIFSQIT